jgi:hypothetical protein
VSARARRTRGATMAGVVVVVVAGAVACSSPEATRMRSGGPGADVGNRSPVVQMHEGSRPFHDTPTRIGNSGLAVLEPASQADRLSRGEGAASPPLDAPPGRP